MSGAFTVFIVDDDPMIHELLAAILGEDFSLKSFMSSEACLQMLPEGLPDLFLLDVELPGMDGYELCRQLKDDSAYRDIPVAFISAHDTIDARLAGYDSGGEDFIVKPFDAEEALRKVRVFERLQSSQRGLKEQAESSEKLVQLVLASMDESGIVLQFMGKIIGISTAQELAEAFLQILKTYGLDGAVQARVGERSHTISADGSDRPLEVSVLNHVRTLGRIFEFKNRGVYNFDRVTVMVSNMPLHDPDLCGRIRDNLAIAAQGADARLLAIELEEQNLARQEGILGALGSVGSTLEVFKRHQQQERLESTSLIHELQEELTRSFVTLGLTESQEIFIGDLVRNYMEQLVELFEKGQETGKILEKLQVELQGLSR